MAKTETSVEQTFSGSKKEQATAQELYRAMQAHGRFMAADAPIMVAFDSAVAALDKIAGGMTDVALKKAIDANPQVFRVEERDGHTYIMTTRFGVAAVERTTDQRHGFAERFLTPQPKPETPPQPIRQRPRVDPSWAALDRMLQQYDLGRIEEEVEEEPAVIEPVEAVEVIVEPEVVEEAPEVPVARTITVPSVPMTDVTGVDDQALAAAIAERLGDDNRVANFGDQWMLEDRVPRFSRGDMRRLRDYIQEQEQPLTDDVLVQDVLNVRPGTADYDLMRFALNFRLSKEHREFDFVGTTNQRFWSVSSLPAIGTTRRKPNEIGTDYRFLLDELPESPDFRSIQTVDHVLTFYEYSLGLLPYDATIQTLLPGPILPNQRSVVLTFECPQSYTTYLVELRYPTPNRGGFILGLDDFYTENLVPGALISIKATENDGHYLVEFLPAPTQSARLLELEDRRQRYVFRPTSFACGVLDEALLSEERFPGLAGEKPLEEKVRRRPEAVVAVTFERLGHKMEGPGYTATFDELLTAANVERPFSERFLRSILDKDETGAFARDPDGADVYTYVPGHPS